MLMDGTNSVHIYPTDNCMRILVFSLMYFSFPLTCPLPAFFI
jgi:hypothetical protein